ncbi:phytoene desaturase family protein [Gordonia sp. (in: high G+C Gram-positive bacteria)]|uniref:phytoene desaturase family protein n=1 Tax=Gordonia sp. (in: high G+C Gram-positive bacteria) TaxID=84139 RepID=UPI001D36C90F|nr:phytoene desaturase family protein [Gordonia sp. (in: high G+C Gram-positive bacteria)]MCB1293950.1 phytoene desaturase [Gordonia sp. (in: high G+C Gram-positive bacteria)]HMS75665.1 phytoene desaturase family protein [Gordonia sp. (in: high G+C Gram-positive bacteria)]
MTANEGRHVVVVGAGLSGLTAALRLRGTGCRVTVVERGATPGGLVRTEQLPAGPRCDTGATVLTMPELIVGALADVGVPADEAWLRLDLVPVDPTYVATFTDGTELTLPRGTDAVEAEIAARLGERDAAGTGRLFGWLRQLYDAEFGTFIDRNFHRPREFADRRTLTDAATLLRLGGLTDMSSKVSSFISDERLQRLFTFQALYAGVPPQRAAAIYGVIAQMDIGRGVWHPRGGIGRVGSVLADALTDTGGDLRLSTTATRIVTSGHRVTGVSTDTGFIAADAVVATVPPPVVASLLGRPLPRGPRWRRVRYSPSAVVVHGIVPRSVTSSWPGHHHTISFGQAWAETFDDLIGKPGRLMRDPSFLITRPAFSDPDGYIAADPALSEVEAVSMLAPCPNLHTADLAWDAITDPYVAECLRTLEDRGFGGIVAGLRIERVDTPRTWAGSGLPAGTPFGAAHTLTQTGPLRTPNAWPSLPNLLLAGSATIPGVGIPPVLISGRLAAERVLESWDRS